MKDVFLMGFYNAQIIIFIVRYILYLHNVDVILTKICIILWLFVLVREKAVR